MRAQSRHRCPFSRVAATIASVAQMALMTGCNLSLEADNHDTPDVSATLATPSGILAISATLYQTIWNTSNGTVVPQNSSPVYWSLMSMAFENFPIAGPTPSIRGAMPRIAISNARSNPGARETFRDYSGLSKNSRTASNVVTALAALATTGQTLGSAGINERTRAFAFFANGVSLGNLALVYDSAAIVTPSVPSDVVPPLRGAFQVMTAALASLDSAADIAASAQAETGFPLPSTWINGRALTAVEFGRMVRSYRARFRAGVARTPAQRAAVDWASVIADVNEGIQTDLNVLLDPTANWGNSWLPLQFQFTTQHQMTPMIIGMADTSGAYRNWLSLPLANRTAFLIKTPDKRFPAGETRAAQNANSPTPPVAPQYFRNRNVASDQTGQAWGSTQYDHYRWQPLNAAGNRGDFPLITLAEMEMLAAEGYLQQGQIAPAALLIDKYRARAGLPRLVGVIADMTTPVPGGNACVPQVPTRQGNATACGTIFEAMKWEKRMEIAYTGWASWYFDSRAWGDLPEGTALEYPVPFQELDARRKPLYDLGGIGGKSAAAKGTYGY